MENQNLNTNIEKALISSLKPYDDCSRRRVECRFLYLAAEALSSLTQGELLQPRCSRVRTTCGVLWSGGCLVFPTHAAHSYFTPWSRHSPQSECLSLHLWPAGTYSDFKTQCQCKHRLLHSWRKLSLSILEENQMYLPLCSPNTCIFPYRPC